MCGEMVSGTRSFVGRRTAYLRPRKSAPATPAPTPRPTSLSLFVSAILEGKSPRETSANQGPPRKEMKLPQMAWNTPASGARALMEVDARRRPRPQSTMAIVGKRNTLRIVRPATAGVYLDAGELG